MSSEVVITCVTCLWFPFVLVSSVESPRLSTRLRLTVLPHSSVHLMSLLLRSSFLLGLTPGPNSLPKQTNFRSPQRTNLPRRCVTVPFFSNFLIALQCSFWNWVQVPLCTPSLHLLFQPRRRSKVFSTFLTYVSPNHRSRINL